MFVLVMCVTNFCRVGTTFNYVGTAFPVVTKYKSNVGGRLEEIISIVAYLMPYPMVPKAKKVPPFHKL